MKRFILITISLLSPFVIDAAHSQVPPTPSHNPTTQSRKTSLNSDEQAFAEYMKADSGVVEADSVKAFQKILKDFKNPKFPDQKYIGSVSSEFGIKPHLEPFIVPGQAMKPSIYFEIAERSVGDLKTKELYLNKIINLPAQNMYCRQVSGPKGVPVREEAYLCLLDLYRANQNREKLCEISEKILKEFPDAEYQVTHWGHFGYSRPEALLVKFKTCSLTVEEKINLLEEVMEKYGDENYAEHGGALENYGEVALDYIREMIFSKVLTHSKVFSLVKGLLRIKTVRIKYGYYLNVILGDSLLASCGRNLNAKTKTAVSHYYKDALSCLSDAGRFSAEDINQNKLKKGASGDFEWFTDSDLSENEGVFDPPVLPSYDLRPIGQFLYFPEKWPKK